MTPERLTKCNECGTLHKGMTPPQCNVCGQIGQKVWLRRHPVHSRRRPEIPEVE